MQEIYFDEDSQRKIEEEFNLFYKVEDMQFNYLTFHMIVLFHTEDEKHIAEDVLVVENCQMDLTS